MCVVFNWPLTQRSKWWTSERWHAACNGSVSRCTKCSILCISCEASYIRSLVSKWVFCSVVTFASKVAGYISSADVLMHLYSDAKLFKKRFNAPPEPSNIIYSLSDIWAQMLWGTHSISDKETSCCQLCRLQRVCFLWWGFYEEGCSFRILGVEEFPKE